MKILLDTNIVLDVLARREPFFQQSSAVMQLVAEGTVQGAVTANSITDIYYILRKHLEKVSLKAAMQGLMELLDIVDVTGEDCISALDLPMEDYEDALLACCAKRWKAVCIVTRNLRDFKNAPVHALEPSAFLESV